MNKETEENLIRWLSWYPESENIPDMERFYELICSIQTNEESSSEFGKANLIHYLNQCQPKWSETKKDNFVKEWELKIELCVNLLRHIGHPNY